MITGTTTLGDLQDLLKSNGLKLLDVKQGNIGSPSSSFHGFVVKVYKPKGSKSGVGSARTLAEAFDKAINEIL